MVIHTAARINEQQFEETVLKADKPVLVDFYSDTCIPCKRMAGVLGEIEDDYEGRLDVVKVNVNYEQGLAGKYDVMSAPTLIYFIHGEQQWRLTGVAKREEITKLVTDI